MHVVPAAAACLFLFLFLRFPASDAMNGFPHYASKLFTEQLLRFFFVLFYVALWDGLKAKKESHSYKSWNCYLKLSLKFIFNIKKSYR